MPNLIAGASIVPELIQGGRAAAEIAARRRRILADPARTRAMRGGLAAVRARSATGAPPSAPRGLALRC